MGLRKLKPTTPGQRQKILCTFDDITSTTPEKSLVVGIHKLGGRNNTGKMTMRYIGGVIGLAIGFYVKYQLDKKFVFVSGDRKVAF